MFIDRGKQMIKKSLIKAQDNYKKYNEIVEPMNAYNKGEPMNITYSAMLFNKYRISEYMTDDRTRIEKIKNIKSINDSAVRIKMAVEGALVNIHTVMLNPNVEFKVIGRNKRMPNINNIDVTCTMKKGMPETVYLKKKEKRDRI